MSRKIVGRKLPNWLVAHAVATHLNCGKTLEESLKASFTTSPSRRNGTRAMTIGLTSFMNF